MTKDLKYIIKRIAIGVGIILALSLIRSIFVLDVSALEIENGHTTPIIYVPENTTLHKCGSFNTNYELSNEGFGYCSTIYVPSVQLHYYSQFYPTLDLEYPYFAESSDNPTYSGQSNANNAWHKNQEYHTLYNLVGIGVSLYDRAFEIEPNHDYSIMVQIDKTNDVDYSFDTLDIEYLYVGMMDSNRSRYDISSYISNVHFDYALGYNTKYETGGDNPFYSNTSYYVIDFHVNGGIESLTNNQTLYFDNLAFYINKGQYDSNEGKYLLTNDNSIFNPESTGNIKLSITFTEGGHIDLEGKCNELDGYCNGVGYEYGGGLDGITLEDEDVFEEYETCETTDIPCHLRNLLKGINNIFIRLGNGIKGLFTNLIKAIQSLFIPNFKNTWQEFQELKNLMAQKLGFLYELEQYFETYLEHFRGITEGEVLINIPEVYVPNFNFVIIHEQTFNLSEPFQTNAILHTLYTFYKGMISCICFFLFMQHGRNRLHTILGAEQAIDEGVVI